MLNIQEVHELGNRRTAAIKEMYLVEVDLIKFANNLTTILTKENIFFSEVRYLSNVKDKLQFSVHLEDDYNWAVKILKEFCGELAEVVLQGKPGELQFIIITVVKR